MGKNQISKQKKLGLTLGGGGTKGFAHIGVYKILHDNKIPIDCIAGTSIGAIVGAGIAQGKTPQEILEITKKLAQKKEKRIKLDSLGITKGSLLNGEKEGKILEMLVPKNLKFDDLKIPLTVNAVDLEKGEEVIFNSGNVFEAVRASSALPGIYPPIFQQGKLLVDGGVLNSIPVDLCKAMGAEIVVAIDLKSFYSEQNISGLIYHFYLQKIQEKKFRLKIHKNYIHEAMLKLGFPMNILMRSMAITERKNAERILSENPPDILIHPDVSQYSLLNFKEYHEIYEKGLEAGWKWIGKIEKLMSLNGEEKGLLYK